MRTEHLAFKEGFPPHRIVSYQNTIQYDTMSISSKTQKRRVFEHWIVIKLRIAAVKLSKRTIILLLLKLKDAEKSRKKKCGWEKYFKSALLKENSINLFEIYVYMMQNTILNTSRWMFYQCQLLLSKVAPLITKTSRYWECIDGFQCLHCAA